MAREKRTCQNKEVGGGFQGCFVLVGDDGEAREGPRKKKVMMHALMNSTAAVGTCSTDQVSVEYLLYATDVQGYI